MKFPKLSKRKINYFFGLLILIVFLLTTPQDQAVDLLKSNLENSLTSNQPSLTISKPTPLPSDNQSDSYRVTKVRDGDTIEIDFQGKTEVVRLVGIDTPETVDPRKPVQCFGQEASQQLKNLLTDQSVSLEIDETQANRDRYGRLLRFVFLNGEDIGLKMLKDGYSQEALFSSQPHKYRQLYLDAQKEAQDNDRGLWADDACPPSPTVTGS